MIFNIAVCKIWHTEFFTTMKLLFFRYCTSMFSSRDQAQTFPYSLLKNMCFTLSTKMITQLKQSKNHGGQYNRLVKIEYIFSTLRFIAI